MPSPFPGMNPYLENPLVWPDIRKRLIVAIADCLNPQLLPHYHVAIEERIYETHAEDSLFVGIPDDVVVKQGRTQAKATPSRTAVAEPRIQPVKVTLPIPQPVREWYLEVRWAKTGDAIAAIEILSPKNKQPGEGRKQYKAKRQKAWASLTHWVEIDLLRKGKPLVQIQDGTQSDYRILVSRAYERPSADLYRFNVQDAIPTFPLPLCSGSPECDRGIAEPAIDLQSLLHEVYDCGSYHLLLDYSQDPVPTLSADTCHWLDGCLKSAALR